jgi:hypothetical protein
LSLAVVVSDATGSWAADDSPTSIHAIRAAVLIPEMVRMSASSLIPAGDFGCLQLIRKGGFPDWLPARQRNDTDISTFRLANARTLFDVTKHSLYGTGAGSGFCLNRTLKQSQRGCLDADRGYIGGKYEPRGIVGHVFQADDFVTDDQVVVAQAYGLADFSINGVNDGFLSQEGAVVIRRFHQLVADFVAYISDRCALAGRH